jgi:hypothetical protein
VYETQTWTDGPAGKTPLSASRLNHMESGIARASRAFDVADFGAVGDGEFDDTSAFQAALDAAIGVGGTLAVSAPRVSWILSRTLTIQPAPGTVQAQVNIQGAGSASAVQWRGANQVPVFRCLGWKRSIVSGVHIDFTNSQSTANVAWDIDTTNAFQSTSLVTFENCFVGLGSHSGNSAWRLGHNSIGLADISFYAWLNCSVNGKRGVTGQRGWINEGSNTLNNTWFGGLGSNLEKMVTNLSDAGSSTPQGDDSMFFYGLGGSQNSLDFEFANEGSYSIMGGRFELGSRFLNVSRASNHASVTVQGVNISSYTPSGGILVDFQRPGSLIWDGNYVRNVASGPLTASAFQLGGFGGLGTLQVRGGAIQASDPFWTDTGKIWQVWIQGLGVLDSQNRTLRRFTTRLGA